MSVVNPVISGLENELRYLPDGPWSWNPNARVFESLAAVAGYVAETYRANLEDFLYNDEKYVAKFERHDALLRRLSTGVEKGFDLLLGHKAQFKAIVPVEAIEQEATEDLRYLFAWFVSGFSRLNSRYKHNEVFNSEPFRARAMSIIDKEMLEVRGVVRELATYDGELIADLKMERRRIADTFEVRVLPVEPLLG